MIIATARLSSQAPLGFNKYVAAPKEQGETGDAYEKRTWKERIHSDKDGMVFIPAMAFKNCLDQAAQFLSMQIPGKGKSTFTKFFKSAVMVLENVPIGIHKDNVEGQWLFLPSDGKKGSGSRVLKCIPQIDSWEADVVYHVLDHTITREVFEKTLEQAGLLIGIGNWRPSSGGLHGRFKVEKLSWEVVK